MRTFGPILADRRRQGQTGRMDSCDSSCSELPGYLGSGREVLTLNPSNVPVLPAGCPWSGWWPPNLKWCESNLCGWITTPANTWSNLAYLLVAVLLWRRAARTGSGTCRAFAHVLFWLGLFSFLYHASYTFFFQVFDFLGMFMLLFLFLVLNLRRAGVVGPGGQLRVYLSGVLSFTALVIPMYFMAIRYQALVTLLTATVLLQEARIWLGGARTRYGRFAAAMTLLGVATGFSALDVTHTWCVPDNHWVQGHALWHVFGAASLYQAALFYDQFGLLGTQAPGDKTGEVCHEES